jgi:hypothetical protein
MSAQNKTTRKFKVIQKPKPSGNKCVLCPRTDCVKKDQWGHWICSDDEDEPETDDEEVDCKSNGDLKCLRCDNPPAWKTLNGLIDGQKSESWGEIAYGNNHLFHWNMCNDCFKKEQDEDETDTEDEDVVCVGCNEFVCKFNDEPPHKDERDEALCEDCFELTNETFEEKEKKILDKIEINVEDAIALFGIDPPTHAHDWKKRKEAGGLLKIYENTMKSRKEKIQLLESLVEEGETLNQKYYDENKQQTFDEWYEDTYENEDNFFPPTFTMADWKKYEQLMEEVGLPLKKFTDEGKEDFYECFRNWRWDTPMMKQYLERKKEAYIILASLKEGTQEERDMSWEGHEEMLTKYNKTKIGKQTFVEWYACYGNTWKNAS